MSGSTLPSGPLAPNVVDSVNQEHLGSLLEAAPDVGTLLGLADRDERWGDPSEAGRNGVMGILRRWTHALDALPDAELSEAEKHDRKLFAAHVDLCAFAHEHVPARRHDPDVLTGAARVLLVQRHATHVPDEARVLALKERLRTLPEHLVAARAVVTEPDARWSNSAAEVAAEFGAFLAGLKDTARHADVPQALRVEFEGALAVAQQGAAEHLDWIRNVSPVEGPRWQVGETLLAALFRHWQWPFGPAELLERTERARVDAQVDVKRAVQRLVPGGTLGDARRLVAEPRPAHPAEALAWLEQAVDRARAFVREQGLFSLAADEKVRVLALPSALRLTAGPAELVPAPRMARPLVGTLLVALPESGAVALSVPEIERTALGCGVPGLHLLEAHASHHLGLLRRGVPLGLFAEPSARWAQETQLGWARYTDALMRRLGWRRSAGARLQRALDALVDAVAAAVDIRLHTGKLTASEARQALTGTAHVDADVADRMVLRMTRHPGEACAALVGTHMMEEARLRTRLAWADQDGPRRFHDLVMGHGVAPMASLLATL